MNRNDYCAQLNDGFGCPFQYGKDYDPERCVECLHDLIAAASLDLKDHFKEYLRISERI